MHYTIYRTISEAAIDDVDARTRRAIVDHGFGTLIDIDVMATMKTRLDVDMPANPILDACNTQVAHRAIVSADLTTVAGQVRNHLVKVVAAVGR